MPQRLNPIERAALRRALLSFYAAAQRRLPWRQSRDPYAIWISEIMLQQTQVETVVPRYRAFMALFPSLTALATAAPETVCDAWAGLGYYRRARHLHRAAQLVLDKQGGRMPTTLAGLLALPGIGRYTAGAIASIAFDLPTPIVDGNVARVFARLFKQTAPANTPAGKKFLWETAEALVQGENPGALNQALMDLGATVCTPRAPSCGKCPVAAFCRAYRDGVVQRYPTVVPRPKPVALSVAFAYVAQRQGVWLVRRPLDSRLWAGLWELPSASGRDAASQLALRLGCSLGPALGQISHRLTHRLVTATIFKVGAPVTRAALQHGPHMRCWPEPLQAPVSTLARKALVLALGGVL